MKTATCPISVLLPQKAPVRKAIAKPATRSSMKTYHTVADVPIRDWKEVIPSTHRCLLPDYLAGVEEGNSDHVDFRYVLFYEGEFPVAFAYFQILTFDVGRIAPFTPEDKSGSFFKRLRSRVSNSFKGLVQRKKVHLLVNGNAYLTGEHGFHHTEAIDPEEAFRRLLAATQQIIREEKGRRRISGVVMKDFYPGSKHPGQWILSKGYQQFQVEPNMVLEMDPEWNSFEDYLQAMSSKYRQRVKSAYKKSHSLESRELTVQDIGELLPRMKTLFRQVAKEGTFSMTDPSTEYFSALKRHLKDDFQILGYYHENTLVAFMTLIKGDRHLEAHFLGYDTSLNRSMKVYQRILFDIVKLGIETGVDNISFGRTAMEIKSTVGAVGRDMFLYIKLTNPLINWLSKPVISNITVTKWTPRHPFREAPNPAPILTASSGSA